MGVGRRPQPEPTSVCRSAIRDVVRTALLAAFAVTACGGANTRVFSPDWQNDHGESIAALEQQLRSQKPPAGKALAVGVVPAGIVAVALDGSSKWSHTMKLDARPVIAGDVVVGSGEGKVTALDAGSGRVLWQVPSNGKAVRGADDNGRVTVVTLGQPPGGGALFMAVDRSGKVIRTLEPSVDIGVPGIVDNTVFLPWGNQYVSAVDLSSGDEVARLLTRTQVSRAESIAGALFFGDYSLVRFDENIRNAWHDEKLAIALPQSNLPGKPRWFPVGTEVAPPSASAPDRVHLYARPTTSGAPSVESQRFVATYFRIALGLDATNGALQWVRTVPADIVGGDGARGGFALCDVSGTVWLIGAAGEDSGSRSLGAPVTACVVQTGDFTIPPGKPAKQIAVQIAEAVSTRQADLIAAQQLVLKEFGNKPDAEITKVLIDLCSEPRTPPAVASQARTLLAARRTGAEYMLQALAVRYDFLSGVLRPPPVGPLADALAAMKEQRAAPLLAEHLNDPTNDTDDIRRAALALVTLATTKEAEDLRTFFSLYRATADDDNVVNAVLSVARALLRIGGDTDHELVRHAAIDPLTHPAVKQGLKNLVGEKG